MTQIKNVTQSCQFCCFAEHDLSQLTTQVGCKAGYLDKFRKKGPDSIVEAYNEKGNFYVINGRCCPAYREWKTPDLDKLKDQLKLKIDVFIMCDKNMEEDEIVNSVAQFDNQTILPRNVVVVLYENIQRDEQGKGVRGKVLPSRLFRRFDNMKVKVEVSEAIDSKSTKEEVIDRLLIGSDSAYYVPVYNSKYVRKDFVSKINSLYFDDFENFIYITSGESTPEVINTTIDHALGGNRDGRTIQEKLLIVDKQHWRESKFNTDGSGKCEPTRSSEYTPLYIKEGNSVWNYQESQ